MHVSYLLVRIINDARVLRLRMEEENTWEGIDDPIERLKHQTNTVLNEIVLNHGFPIVSGIGNTIFYRTAAAIDFPVVVVDEKKLVGTRSYYNGKLVESWLPKSKLGLTSEMCVPWSVDNFAASFASIVDSYFLQRYPLSKHADRQAYVTCRKEEFREQFKNEVWKDIEEYGEGILWCDGYRINRDAFESAINRISIPAYVQSMEFGGEANGPINPIDLFKIKEWFNLKQSTMPRANAIDAFVKGLFLANLIEKKGYCAKYIGHETLEVACVSIGTKVLDPWLGAPPIELNAPGHPRANVSPKWLQY